MASLVAASLVAVSGEPAAAATGDFGHAGPTYSGVSNPPTADKPQSKLWFNDGLWWANMWTASGWYIHRLDRSTDTWVNTGTAVDARPQSLSDALWDGSKLYIGSQYVTVSDDVTVRPSVSQPARFYRYSYDSVAKTYSLDAGFPSAISNNSSESLTIDKDTTGRLWASWTKVSGSSTTGYTTDVYVNSSADGATWETPTVLPAPGANTSVGTDDISAIVAYGKSSPDKGQIGVLWSNHLDDTVYWAIHKDGDPLGTWKGSVAVRGSKQVDDHMNLKSIDADAHGRVAAAVKTSLDELSTSAPTDPQVNLLVFKPGTGSWSTTNFGTLADCHTRPLVMLDSTNNEVHMFATGPTESGCAFAGKPGTIYEKTTSYDTPQFPAGRGTPVIRDVVNANMNNVTSTKQSVTYESGLVVLASNNTTKRYWHADQALRAPTPTASFTTSATTGSAPLTVSFTDSSTNSPTSWAWDFGNGTSSTAQNPTATYSAAGTYTVTLRASNSGGTSTAATKTITVTAPGGSTPRTVTLNPNADAMVKQASSGTNYGSVTSLSVDGQETTSTSSAINSYLRFSVPALNPGESITAARLSLNATNGTTNGPLVYRTSPTWAEGSVTWVTGRPARSSSTAVGNFASMAVARVSTAVSGVTTAGEVSFELVPEVTDGLAFTSRENATISNQPQLVLTVSSTGGSTGTTAPLEPTVSPASGTFTSAQSVSMSSSEPGAVIRYTIGDGTTVPVDPSSSSPVYTAPITVSTSQVIKARAFDAAGNGSTVAQRSYTISAPGGSTPRTVTLNPNADAMVKQASSGTNYGSVTSLSVDGQETTSTSSAINSYLRFSVPALNPGESITAARLSLNATNGTTNGPLVYRTSPTWAEGSMTWVTGRPARSSSTAVGNFASMAVARVSTAVSGVTTAGEVSFELVPEVTDGLAFTSRENATVSNQPQLILTISS